MAKFKKEPLDYIKGELTCPVMGDPAEKDTFVVHNDVKYYLCCTSARANSKEIPISILTSSAKMSTNRSWRITAGTRPACQCLIAGC
jgi:hypothetical protein